MQLAAWPAQVGTASRRAASSIARTRPNSCSKSTGMFTYWNCYGIRDCIDGTSNTIAFSESLVGDQSLIVPVALPNPVRF